MAAAVRSRAPWVLGAFLVIAAFFLVTEHTAHFFGVLPFLLLAACPLLHIFSHGDHKAHGRDGGGNPHAHSQDKRGVAP